MVNQGDNVCVCVCMQLNVCVYNITITQCLYYFLLTYFLANVSAGKGVAHLKIKSLSCNFKPV